MTTATAEAPVTTTSTSGESCGTTACSTTASTATSCSTTNVQPVAEAMGLQPKKSAIEGVINLTENAATEVRRIIAEQEATGTTDKLHLRVRVVGGGCSGFQHKLDLGPDYNEKIDEIGEIHGVSVVIDKRSLLYLEGVTIEFYNDINRRGFRIENPKAKGTCGCGSSFSM